LGSGHALAEAEEKLTNFAERKAESLRTLHQGKAMKDSRVVTSLSIYSQRRW
jgi:hypothetical protein